jgi:hypothetical protein
MKEKYLALWKKEAKLSDMLMKISSAYPDSPDWCALCQKEIDGELIVHLRIYHNYDLLHHLECGGNYDIENNSLIEKGIVIDLDRYMEER